RSAGAGPRSGRPRTQLRQRPRRSRRARPDGLETRRMMLAIQQPPSGNLPLFLHVLGATLPFGATGTVALLGFAALRADPERTMWLRGLAFRLGGYVLVPAFILMRAGAQWIADKEYPGNAKTPGWLDVG